jgi:pectin methylesterase-like acyl-CoA thioesterase
MDHAAQIGRQQKPRLVRIACGVFCGALIAISLGAAQISQAPGPPRVSFTVDAAGPADFKTVQQAVDALPAVGGVIRIRPGTYREQIHIDKPHVTLIGLGKIPSEVVLTYNLSHHDVGSTFATASTYVSGDDFLAENITFQNTFSDEHPDADLDAQAVALRVTGDRDVFRHIRVVASQDALYADTKTCLKGTDPCAASRQLYADSYIAGTVDFIFGAAKAVFERSEIHSRLHQVDSITAQSRLDSAEDSGYVFDHCMLSADPGVTDVYLGRPWRLYATVIFLNTDMGAHIDPAGWAEWMHDGRSGLANAFYAEYGSYGDGAPHGASQTAPANGYTGASANGRISQDKILTAKEAAKFAPRDFLRGADIWLPKL